MLSGTRHPEALHGTRPSERPSQLRARECSHPGAAWHSGRPAGSLHLLRLRPLHQEEGVGEGRPPAGDGDGEGRHPDPPLQPAQQQQQEHSEID